MGRAAERCSVTQPALSMQIQELERALEVALLERLPKGVRLTEAGAAIAARARGILLEVEDLRACAQTHATGLGASLRFGVIPTIAPYLLPSAIQRWREAYPTLRPEIRESQTAVLVRELINGELDLILAALPIEHPELEGAPLFEDRFLFVEPSPTPLRRSDSYGVAPRSFKEQRLLLLEEGHCLRDQTLAVWPLGACGEISRYGASSLSTLVQMAAGGMGVTLIPEMSVGVEAVGRNVRLSRFPGPEPRRRLGLVWRKASPRRRAFEAIGALLCETRAEIGA